MPRKFRNIVDCIKATPKEIINYLDEKSVLHGKSSWLVVHPKSQNRVCLVAHIDTIYAPPKTVLVSDNLYITSAPNEGLGADDRAGVWALLKLYNDMPDEDKPMLLFTDGEERGGIGAHELVRDEKMNEALKDVIFFIELDRHGSDDCVFYNQEPEKFKRFIEQYGFKKSFGTFSDITIIGRHFKKCAVNLSVGYQNEHSTSEHLNMKALYATVKKVREILRTNCAIRTVWDNEFKNYESRWTSSPAKSAFDNIPEYKPKKFKKSKKASMKLPVTTKKDWTQESLLDFVTSAQHLSDEEEAEFNKADAIAKEMPIQPADAKFDEQVIKQLTSSDMLGSLEKIEDVIDTE